VGDEFCTAFANVQEATRCYLLTSTTPIGRSKAPVRIAMAEPPAGYL
jgi:hypothetical protein